MKRIFDHHRLRPYKTTDPKQRLQHDSSAPLSYESSSFLGPTVVVRDIDLAREVLERNANNYIRWIPFVPAGSLFPSEGEDYERHRHVVTSAMKSQFVRQLNDLVESSAHELVKAIADRLLLTDVYQFMIEEVATAIITLTWGRSQETKELAALSRWMRRDAVAALFAVLPAIRHLPLPAIRDRDQAFTRSKEIRKKILSALRTDGEDGPHYHTLLGLLDRANSSAPSPLNDEEILSNAVGMSIGGNDSTAAGLTAVLYHLAVHPSIQERLHQELTQGHAQGNRYLRAVIKESFRLVPSFGTALPRYTQHDNQLGDWTIQKGTCVVVHTTDINHSPRHWTDAERFDPTRFLARSGDNPENHRAVSLTFGMGKRSCIGIRIAESITCTWIQELVRQFSVELAEASAVHKFIITREGLNLPSPPLKLRFRPRSAAGVLQAWSH